MEAKATAKYLKGSPQKARLVVDLVRGKKVEDALGSRSVGVLDVAADALERLVEGRLVGQCGHALQAYEPAVLQPQEHQERDQGGHESQPQWVSLDEAADRSHIHLASPPVYAGRGRNRGANPRVYNSFTIETRFYRGVSDFYVPPS